MGIEERLAGNEGFKTRVEKATNMSTTSRGPKPDDREELGEDDAPD